MNKFSFIYKIAIFYILCIFSAHAQINNKVITRQNADTSSTKLNMDAIYNRPFLTFNKLPIAIGGYAEVNSSYATIDGTSSGLNFQMRRMTLFFSSTIAKKIKFLSELEFEEGTKEINIETAVLDLELHPLLNFRGGILLNPIGGFNQNHDGPRWDFIDRPVASREIIPATLSNVGFGFYGKHFYNKWTIGYETYITNGFDDKLISNEDNHTSFHEAKENADKFNTSNSGSPLFNGKIAIRNRNIGEMGVSFLSGIYNQNQKDGKRNASIIALDMNTSLLKNRISIVGEIAKAFIQVPTNYDQMYGTKQFGGYCDIVATIAHRRILGWDHAKINIGARFDYADFNQDKIKNTQAKIYDELWGITPSLAFRPVGTLVARLNYKITNAKDFTGNTITKSSVILFGLSSYF